jgi:hypothetical protein
VDLGGYPDMLSPKEASERFINYILPQIYKPMILGTKKVVALLDEVDKADVSLCAPLLEFVNTRSINGRLLPNLQCCIMTGNLISEGGSRPPLPLLDRTEKYLVEASAEQWLAWALDSGEIHPAVYQYISDNHNALIGLSETSDNYSDESPRGWHQVSKITNFGECHNWSTRLIQEKVAGCIGKKSAMHYESYYTNYKVLLPIVDRIFKGEDYTKDFKDLVPTEQMYVTLIVCSRFSNQLDKADAENLPLPDSVNAVGKFMILAGHENVFMSIRQVLNVKRVFKYKLDTNPIWHKIFKEMKELAISNEI